MQSIAISVIITLTAILIVAALFDFATWLYVKIRDRLDRKRYDRFNDGWRDDL